MGAVIDPSEPPPGSPSLQLEIKPATDDRHILDVVQDLLGRHQCSPDVLRFLAGMGVGADVMKEVVSETRKPGYEGLAGGNALTFLKLYHVNLRDLDLRDCNLTGADLSMSDLSGCDLRGANLTQVDFSYCNLKGANFSNCNLREARFGGRGQASILAKRQMVGYMPRRG